MATKHQALGTRYCLLRSGRGPLRALQFALRARCSERDRSLTRLRGTAARRATKHSALGTRHSELGTRPHVGFHFPYVASHFPYAGSHSSYLAAHNT